MNFDFTEEQLMIQESARDFAQNEIAPSAVDRDIKAEFPADIIKENGRAWFYGNDGFSRLWRSWNGYD